MGLIAADESDSVVLYSEGAMFFRFKKSGQRTYIQIVENKRVDGAVRQSVIANLGRADELAASGALASLLATGAKLTDQVLLINALDEDADGALSVSAKRIGGPLLFDQLSARRRRCSGRSVEGPRLRICGGARRLRFHSASVISASGSDFDCASCMEDYDIPGAEGLDLHHFYRAMAWLGEEMEEKSEVSRRVASRMRSRLEQLISATLDLFSELAAKFETTWHYVFGDRGVTSLFRYRPDLNR